MKQYLNEAIAHCEKLLEAQPTSRDRPDEQTPIAVIPTKQQAQLNLTAADGASQSEQSWMQACQTVANILTSMGFIQEAYPWRSMALDPTPDSAKFYAESGRVCSQCEDWDRAIYFCQRTLEYDPDNAAVHCQLAKVYHHIGDRTAETNTLNDLLAKRPDRADAEGHYQLGQILRGQGQAEAAIVCYQRAIEQNKQYEPAYYALGDLWVQQGKPTLTVELFKQLVQQLPKTAQARYRLGRAYKQTQQFELAIEAFKAAISIDPQLHWAYMGSINILMQSSRFDEVIATCQGVIQAAKQDNRDVAWAYCFMGNAHARKGENALATRAHQQAFVLRGWRQASERDYQFKLTWFSENISIWSKYLEPLNRLIALRHPLRMLSLGTEDGSSLLWLTDNILTASEDRLLCLSDRISSQFQNNREKLFEADKLVLQTNNISAQIEDIEPKTLDFAYIQSDRKQADYLQSVSPRLWKAIKPEGLMCFKDYQWQHPNDPTQSSKVGIDTFIASVRDEVEVLCRSHQVILRKRP